MNQVIPNSVKALIEHCHLSIGPFCKRGTMFWKHTLLFFLWSIWQKDDKRTFQNAVTSPCDTVQREWTLVISWEISTKRFCIYQILIFGAESGMMMLRISSSFFGFACIWYKFFRVWILCFFIKQYSMLPSPKKYSKNYLVPPPVASCTVVSNLLVRAFPNP